MLRGGGVGGGGGGGSYLSVQWTLSIKNIIMTHPKSCQNKVIKLEEILRRRIHCMKY